MDGGEGVVRRIAIQRSRRRGRLLRSKPAECSYGQGGIPKPPSMASYTSGALKYNQTYYPSKLAESGSQIFILLPKE